jgi:hypothetical protein
VNLGCARSERCVARVYAREPKEDRPCSDPGLAALASASEGVVQTSRVTAPIKSVQERLGPCSLEMTMRCAHLSPDVRRDAVKLLDVRESVRLTWTTWPRGSNEIPCCKARAVGSKARLDSRQRAAVHDELAAHTRHMKAPRLRIAGFFYCLEWSRGGSNHCPPHCERGALVRIVESYRIASRGSTGLSTARLHCRRAS